MTDTPLRRLTTLAEVLAFTQGKTVKSVEGTGRTKLTGADSFIVRTEYTDGTALELSYDAPQYYPDPTPPEEAEMFWFAYEGGQPR